MASRYGAQTPVTVTLRIRQGADLWLEVVTDEGRFFAPFDCSTFDLVQQIIKGGHQVEPLSTIVDLEHRKGKGHLAQSQE